MKKDFAPLLDKNVPVANKIMLLDKCQAQAWQGYLEAKDTGHKGLFRTFFAQMFGVSETTVQRVLGLKKLSSKVVGAIDAHQISTTFGEAVASYPCDWQDEIIDGVVRGELQGKIAEIRPFLRLNHPEVSARPKQRARKKNVLCDEPCATPATEPQKEDGNQKPFDFQYTISQYPVSEQDTSYNVKHWLLVQTKDFYEKLAEYAIYRKKLSMKHDMLDEAAWWDACLNELQMQNFLISSRIPQKDAERL